MESPQTKMDDVGTPAETMRTRAFLSKYEALTCVGGTYYELKTRNTAPCFGRDTVEIERSPLLMGMIWESETVEVHDVRRVAGGSPE